MFFLRFRFNFNQLFPIMLINFKTLKCRVLLNFCTRPLNVVCISNFVIFVVKIQFCVVANEIMSVRMFKGIIE